MKYVNSFGYMKDLLKSIGLQTIRHVGSILKETERAFFFKLTKNQIFKLSDIVPLLIAYIIAQLESAYRVCQWICRTLLIDLIRNIVQWLVDALAVVELTDRRWDAI